MRNSRGGGEKRKEEVAMQTRFDVIIPAWLETISFIGKFFRDGNVLFQNFLKNLPLIVFDFKYILFSVPINPF